jgi:hypothetical protein
MMKMEKELQAVKKTALQKCSKDQAELLKV